MYAAFARLNYKPWYALAEFVDNSLQSFLSSRIALSAVHGSGWQLRVIIDFSEHSIVIRDNAAGIAAVDFPRAFMPASPPPNPSGLSEFGLGMKAAACWFSKQWTVRTSALGEPFESIVSYDVPAITSQHIERLPVRHSPVNANEHYTVITLNSLNVKLKANTVLKIRRHLASMYRKFLENGALKLVFDGEVLTHETAAYLRAPRYDEPQGAAVEWRKVFRFELDETHRISGWAALLDRASVANAGFSVFRRDRLVEGSYGEAYRPEKIFRKSNSYTYQRLVGEINVEGFSVSHTKDGVQWDEWEDDLLDWLRGELDSEPLPLLRQAENHRSRTSQSVNTLELIATDAEQMLAQQVPRLIDEQLQQASESGGLPEMLAPVKVVSKRVAHIFLRHAQQQWHVEVELVSDESRYEWLEIAKEERQTGEYLIRIQINMVHPFMVRFATPGASELIGFVRLAAALAISEVTARAVGLRQGGAIRRNLNQLLREALSGPFDSAEDTRK